MADEPVPDLCPQNMQELAARDQATADARTEAAAIASYWLILRESGLPVGQCNVLTQHYAEWRQIIIGSDD